MPTRHRDRTQGAAPGVCPPHAACAGGGRALPQHRPVSQGPRRWQLTALPPTHPFLCLLRSLHPGLLVCSEGHGRAAHRDPVRESPSTTPSACPTLGPADRGRAGGSEDGTSALLRRAKGPAVFRKAWLGRRAVAVSRCRPPGSDHHLGKSLGGPGRPPPKAEADCTAHLLRPWGGALPLLAQQTPHREGGRVRGVGGPLRREAGAWEGVGRPPL